MPQVARVTDTGQGDCPAHRTTQHYTTTLSSGASTVFANNLNMAVVNSVGQSTCGHPTHATAGSPTVFAEGKPVHRVNDVGTNPGPYHAVTGSTDVFADS